MTGTIRIEFQIMEDSGQCKIMLHAPLENQEQKELTIKVLASSIPIALQYEIGPIIKASGGNGKPPLTILPKGN